MFKYEKEFLIVANVEQENPQYAEFMREQLSGINMGLKLSIQFMSQGHKFEEGNLSTLLLDLAAEELEHYELISRTVNLLYGSKEKILNVFGNTVSNDSMVVTGEPCTDLLSDIALEQQAKSAYETLYKQIDDEKIKNILRFIINREENHSLLLREAFNKIQREKIKENYKTSKEPQMCFSVIKPKLCENSYDEFKNTPPTYGKYFLSKKYTL